jgi:hypothetical protein
VSAHIARSRLLYIVRADRIAFVGEHVRRRGMVFVDPRIVIVRVLANGAIVVSQQAEEAT